MNYQRLEVTEQDYARTDFTAWLTRLERQIRLENDRLYREAQAQAQRLIAEAERLYGAKSVQARYLRKQGVPKPPNLTYQASKTRRERQNWLDAQAKAARRERNKQKREAKRQAELEAHQQERARRRPLERELRYRSRATLDELQLAGYIPNEDFVPTQAISFARRLTYAAQADERLTSVVAVEGALYLC